MEQYLEETWVDASRHVPCLGSVPTGPAAISLMRLVVQAQTSDAQQRVFQSYTLLPRADKDILAHELRLR